MKKPIVIAGNGSSTKLINYQRLPKNFEVFRINQFYFEENYYLGNKIDYMMFNRSVFEYHAWMIHLLERYNLYHFDKLICSTSTGESQLFTQQYPYIDFCDFKKELYSSIFGKYISELLNFYNTWPNSGTIALMYSIINGYKDIYLVGIDLNESTDLSTRYCFNTSEKLVYNNVMQIKDHILTQNPTGYIHNSQIEREIIQKCSELDGINIYSIVDDSNLSKILPLAPILEEHFVGFQNKPYVQEVQDWTLLPNVKQKYSFVKNLFLQRNMLYEYEELSQNSVLRFFYSIFKSLHQLSKIVLMLISRSFK